MLSHFKFVFFGTRCTVGIQNKGGSKIISKLESKTFYWKVWLDGVDMKSDRNIFRIIWHKIPTRHFCLNSIFYPLCNDSPIWVFFQNLNRDTVTTEKTKRKRKGNSTFFDHKRIWNCNSYCFTFNFWTCRLAKCPLQTACKRTTWSRSLSSRSSSRCDSTPARKKTWKEIHWKEFCNRSIFHGVHRL